VEDEVGGICTSCRGEEERIWFTGKKSIRKEPTRKTKK
jgi:hypothetical protein